MIKVLAVADPAVLTYADKDVNIISKWTETSGVEVEFSILPWAEYFAALMETLSGNGKDRKSDYDIVMVAGHLWLQDFINRGFLQPLEGIKAAITNYGPYEDLLPGVRDEIELDGKVWLTPSFTDGHIIYYKKERIFELTGRHLPKILTPSEYLALVKEIGNNPAMEDKKFLAMKAHPSEIFLDWLPFYYEEGKSVFDENLNLLFNTPEAARALGRYLELKEFALPGAELFGNEEVCAALQSDDCLIGVSWGGQASFIINDEILKADNMGYATFETPWNVSWSFGVPASADFTNEVRDFLAYLASPEVDRIIGKGAGSPVRSASYKAENSLLPWYPIQEEMISRSKRLPGFTGSGDVYGLFYKWIFQAFTGEISPEEALAELEKAVSAEIKKLHT
ncbi:MAG: extracellular solute-binding protein [Spirochaetales bacterium]|nr:extracellular solute-binding protein [Spirochaetales bacterium]